MSLPETITERKARLAARMKEWRAKNREHWLEYCRERRKNNPEKFKKYKEDYLSKNPQRVLELRKKSNVRRRDYIKKWNKAYHDRNRERINKQKAKRDRERLAADPGYKCKKMLKNRIYECLKLNKTIKSKRTMELIGCDRDCLVKWLESKFVEGMTWQNHGVRGWHIDHVIPCASFDLTDIEQQKKCFHYTNLQPLWAKQNRIKSDKCHYQNT